MALPITILKNVLNLNLIHRGSPAEGVAQGDHVQQGKPDFPFGA